MGLLGSAHKKFDVWTGPKVQLKLTYLLLVHIVNDIIKVNCNIVSTFQQKLTSPSKALSNSTSGPYKKEYGNFSFKNTCCFAERKHKRKHVKMLTQELYQETCHVINPSAFKFLSPWKSNHNHALISFLFTLTLNLWHPWFCSVYFQRGSTSKVGPAECQAKA